MKVEFARKDFGSVSADLLVVPCFKGKIPAWAHAELLKAGVEKDFVGEKGRTYMLPAKGKPYGPAPRHSSPDVGCRALVSVGTGRRPGGRTDRPRRGHRER